MIVARVKSKIKRIVGRFFNRNVNQLAVKLLDDNQHLHVDQEGLACWCCEEKELESIPPTYSKVLTCICRSCGLVQRRKKNSSLEIDTNGFYYGENFESAYKGIKKRQLHVETRLNIYIDYIGEFLDLKKISTHVDIGGAEGLLSYLLCSKIDTLQSVNVDPDPACIEYGKKYYRNIQHVIGSSESPVVEGQHDLVTDFGGIYRAVNPLKALENYYNLLNDDGYLVITFNVIPDLKSARTNEYPNAFCLYDPPVNNVFQRSFFDIGLCREFLKTRFEIINERMIVPFPFFQKELPFFVCKKRVEVQLLKKEVNKYDEILGIIKSYPEMVTAKRLAELKLSYGDKVVIIGDTWESQILSRCCKSVGIKVVSVITTHFRDRVDDPDVPLQDWRAFIDVEFDFCIVGDIARKEEIEGVIKFCQLDKIKPVISTVDTTRSDIPLYVNWSGEKRLFKAFEFIMIKSSRRFTSN